MQGTKAGSSLRYRVERVQEVTRRARQPVEARNQERVAFARAAIARRSWARSLVAPLAVSLKIFSAPGSAQSFTCASTLWPSVETRGSRKSCRKGAETRKLVATIFCTAGSPEHQGLGVCVKSLDFTQDCNGSASHGANDALICFIHLGEGANAQALRLIASVLLLFAACTKTLAAEITESATTDGVVIAIRGDLEAGDDRKFNQVAQRYSKGSVYLESRGGDLVTGIAIGESIS